MFERTKKALDTATVLRDRIADAEGEIPDLATEPNVNLSAAQAFVREAESLAERSELVLRAAKAFVDLRSNDVRHASRTVVVDPLSPPPLPRGPRQTNDMSNS